MRSLSSGDRYRMMHGTMVREDFLFITHPKICSSVKFVFQHNSVTTRFHQFITTIQQLERPSNISRYVHLNFSKARGPISPQQYQSHIRYSTYIYSTRPSISKTAAPQQDIRSTPPQQYPPTQAHQPDPAASTQHSSFYTHSEQPRPPSDHPTTPTPPPPP